MQNPASLLKLTSLDGILIRQEASEARLYGLWEDWTHFIRYAADSRLNVATPSAALSSIPGTSLNPSRSVNRSRCRR